MLLFRHIAVLSLKYVAVLLSTHVAVPLFGYVVLFSRYVVVSLFTYVAVLLSTLLLCCYCGILRVIQLSRRVNESVRLFVYVVLQ